MQTMISAPLAWELVLREAKARALPSVLAPVARCLGLYLAEEVVADRDYPPFDRSVMDGFAVRVAHAGRTVAVAGEARPGLASTAQPDDDHCVEIMTGSPCPAGTEAVVMKEQVERGDGVATFPAKIARGQNIVPTGSECARGAVVVPEGARLTPIALGLLAAMGVRAVAVRRTPNVALLVTGDELVASGEDPSDVEIRDSNGPMLASMARAAGFPALAVSSVRDTREALARALEASSAADVVVLTGGVSMGNYDLVPGALKDHGATVVFHKVDQQPGRPILFAVHGERLFFGLPGTPLGCHLGFHRYVIPALRALAGGEVAHEADRGSLTGSWSTKSDRRQFVLAKIERSGASFRVTPLRPKGSSDLFTVWSANAYLDLPDGTRDLAEGAEVSFEWLETIA